MGVLPIAVLLNGVLLNAVLLSGVDANVNSGGLPAVCGVDVVGASGAGAKEILMGLQQDVVAGAGPGLLRCDVAVAVYFGIEEEIDGGPARSAGDAMR